MCGLFAALLLLAVIFFSAVSALTMPGMAITVQRSSQGGDFLEPHSIHKSSWAADNNRVLISDAHAIYKVKPTTPQWLAYEHEVVVGIKDEPGFVDGEFSKARFNHIVDFVQSDDGEQIYISDDQNHCVRVADRSTKQVNVFAGNCTNPGNSTGHRMDSSFRFPKEIIFSHNQRYLFIADFYNDRIVRLDNNTEETTALFEDNSNFRRPHGMTKSPDSDILYASTQLGVYEIRQPLSTTPVISLVTASVRNGADLKVTSGNRMLITADTHGDRLLFHDLNSGLEASFCIKPYSTVAESFDGPSDRCYLKGPQGIGIVNDNTLLVSEHHAKIRKITFSYNVITTPDPSITTTTTTTTQPTTKLYTGPTVPYPHKSMKPSVNEVPPEQSNSQPPQSHRTAAIVAGTLAPLLLIGGIAGCLAFIIIRQKRLHARERQQMYERRNRHGGFTGPAFAADPKYVDSFETPPYSSSHNQHEGSLPSYSTGSYEGGTGGNSSGGGASDA